MDRVAVTISDPFDWVTDHGEGPFWGSLVLLGKDSLLIRLDKGIPSKQGAALYLHGVRNIATKPLSLLPTGERVPCALLPIPAGVITSQEPREQLNQANALADSWRDGFLLGSVTISAA